MIAFWMLGLGCGLKTTNQDTNDSASTDAPEPEVQVSDTNIEIDSGINSDTGNNTDTNVETFPQLSDFWNGDAEFVFDDINGPFGPPSFHFFSSFWDQNQTLWAYYILHGQYNFVTGLATSQDGLDFTDHGMVLGLGGLWQWEYHGINDFYHNIGSADSDGWAVSVANDSAGYLSFGPYVSTLPEGKMTVEYELMIDNNSDDDVVVLHLDIFDTTTQTVLAHRSIQRTDFISIYSYQRFSLEYTQISGHNLEFRVYWAGNSYNRLRKVGVSQGQEPLSDNILATFPGVWQDDELFYMVYEGAGSSTNGDIHLATSNDGFNWIKSANNPILIHDTNNWESINIGTPSLWKEGNLWYLFYHGYDGDDCQVGLATGTDLNAMTRVSSLPIISVSANGWDSGTIGRRSIYQEGSTYYMVYEGSTDPPYDQANWSSGLARSNDLQTWEKYPDNPILPQTGVGFGFDGPEWVETPDGRLHIYYRAPEGETYRSTLTWK